MSEQGEKQQTEVREEGLAAEQQEKAVEEGGPADEQQEKAVEEGGPADEQQEKAAEGGLTDEQIAAEEKFMEGLPPVNIGALFMPGIWGPAHGFWVCILFYPLYIFADYMFYGTYAMPEVWTIALAVITGVLLVALHIAFARVSGPLAAHRAESKGISRETYLKRERIWAVVSIVLAIAALAWATYYNLDVRTVLK